MNRRRRGIAAVIRRLAVAFLAFAVVLAAAGLGVGWWARGRVEAIVAQRIEQQLPGSKARVGISSFPFLGHLAASGTISELSVHVSDLPAGPLSFNGIHLAALTFTDVDIHIDDLHMRRDPLLHGRVMIDRIRRATVTATLDEKTLDQSVGLPISLGAGTVGIGGLSLPADIAVDLRRITLTVPGQISLTVSAPPLDVLPCVGGVDIAPGGLKLTCVIHRLPAVLAHTSFSY